MSLRGVRTIDTELSVQKKKATDKIIALAGNPNVGKSTVLVVSVTWNGIK